MGCGATLRYWPVVFSLLMMACASAPRITEARFSQEYFTSRGGALRYRLPGGWLNATEDSPSSTNIIWLVRNDFAATLGVKEIVVDTETRREIQRTGLKRVAELTLALTSGERGVSVVQVPELSSLRAVNVCSYEYLTGPPGDRIHALLVDTGARIFEVSMLITQRVPQAMVEEIVMIQKNFVQNLKW